MQVIKYVEERVLSLGGSGEFLNIIYYQYIYCLVESDEIIEMIGSYWVGILYLKQVGRNVKYSFLRIKFLDSCTDSIY